MVSCIRLWLKVDQLTTVHTDITKDHETDRLTAVQVLDTTDANLIEYLPLIIVFVQVADG